MSETKLNTSEHRRGAPSEIDWLTFGKVGDSSTGEAFKKAQLVPQSVLVDEPDANTTYVGFAEPGSASSASVWRIMKVSISGTVTSIQWADGNVLYDNIWDNRASLSYS